MGKLPVEGAGRGGARRVSRLGSRALPTRGAALGSAATSLSASDEKTRRASKRTPPLTKGSLPAAVSTPGLGEGREQFHVVKSLFKPYQGDLFGNSGKDNTQGMLYLSRMDPSRDPKKTRVDTAEEQRHRSLAQYGAKEGEDFVAEQEAHRAAGEERRRRLAISLATLSKKPEKRANVVANGGVAALAKLSRSEESRTRSSCAEVFNNLATERSLRQRMIEEGAAPAIIALAASSHNRHLRSQCVEALCKLAVVPGSEAQIIAEGGVSCILAVQRAVPSLGGLAGTVEEDESLERLLIQLLCNLSGFKNNQLKLVEEGAIRIISRAAERTASVDVVRLCASTLCNFAGEGRARPKMSDSRTAQALLNLTKHEDIGIRREVAHTIARLAADASCREKILQYGIIPILVTMSTAPDLDTTTGRCIALAFRVLSSDRKFAEIIVDGGAVDALISLTRSTDSPCRLSCAQSLCNLIRFAIRLDYLIECGVVSALVRLADPGDEATSECCAAALYLFFCHPAVLALIDGREVIRALMDLCRVGTTSVRKRCVAAIWNMTNVEQVAHSGGSAAESIPMLLGLLQTESDKALQADCAAALYNLARNQENCQAMIVSGAVPPVIVLAKSGSFETKTQCMSILQRMLLGRTMPEEIMTKSFVRTLLDMSKMEHRDTQQRVVIAVYRISCCERGRELLLEEGAPESLIRLISKPNEEMRKGCANTLLNLAYDHGREIEITKCGAVSVLLITALVASDSDETRHACTKALTNLLCEKQAHRGMFKDGVVWGLAAMSRSNDVTIAKLCSVALCNLSCEYWKEIAMSNCMQAVYGLARSSDEAVMSAGMKALHNVLLRAQHLEGVGHIFSGTVPIARRALMHKSKEIRLVGVRLTNLVSTALVARQTAMLYRIVERVNVGDFDSDEPLSYSFCCALERFALDPATRSSVLHSGCIDNFTALCAMSGRIMSRLAQFMYSVSCSPELVPSLVLEHDGMKVIAAVLEPVVQEEEDGSVEGRQGGGAGSGGGEDRKESLDGAKETCAALLFNMSTQDEVKTELVLKGGIRLAFALWEGASPEARRSCSLVACNLAVGKVNTAKMVRHGAGQLLVELVKNTDPLNDAGGNHVQLAEEGVIPALIDLAKTDCPVVRRNCASAMRSMTCKAEVRQLLVASGAIKVILDDATNQDADESLTIDNELLCEIEAESWVNGTRGILVESRAPVLPMLEQNCSLLPAPADSRTQKAARVAAAAAIEKEAGDALYSMPWQKLQALDVDLREPDMEVSTKQDDAKRYDDPGINAALAGDTDADGPRGLPSSTSASCGKVEPKEASQASRTMLGHPDDTDEEDSSLRGSAGSSSSINGTNCNNNNNNNRDDSSNTAFDNEEGHTDSTSHSSCGGKVNPLMSLGSTPEEDEDDTSSDSDGGRNDNSTADGSGSSWTTATKSRRHRQQRSSSVSEATSTSSESDGGLSNEQASWRRGKRRGGVQMFGRQHQPPAGIDGMPDPSVVDWEVAVVRASANADEMVERYIQTRKEIHPARRGSVNISSIGSPRRSSVLQPTGGGINSNAMALTASRRSSLFPAAASRRGSVQAAGNRRASGVLFRPQHQATQGGTGNPVGNAAGRQARRVSVSHPTIAAGGAGRRASRAGGSITTTNTTSTSKSVTSLASVGEGGTCSELEIGVLSHSDDTTSLTMADTTQSSGKEGMLPLSSTEHTGNDSGGAAGPLETVIVEAARGGIRSFMPIRGGTFDAEAGRFPL
ncbi:conserved unknown protein [Ectocarpus siliculosus]|uniref:Uncharacterized protein n=1 Tax=Ectocarpus siliculosus TaxID=2880 RepID=D8LR74_ECTSI|nr:conserved unknown protein [Ectocarpus siliculosus]|eukprot:CBN77747.1 conserved unknown protein [Ectocarpus siliculosus]